MELEDWSTFDDFFSSYFVSTSEMEEDWGLIVELDVKQLLAKALTLPA